MKPADWGLSQVSQGSNFTRAGICLDEEAGSPASSDLESYALLFGWSVGLGMFLLGVLLFQAGLTDLGPALVCQCPQGVSFTFPQLQGNLLPDSLSPPTPGF